MKAVWKRIHVWLKANAPEGYGDLRPGASPQEIRAAEEAIGMKLPADVKASYRIHDGQGNEPGLIGGEGWCLLSLRRMVEISGWRSRAQLGDVCFVPIAWGGAGDCVFLYLDPPAGLPGQLMVQRSDRDAPDPLAPSFRSWLEDFADQLEDGELAYCEDEGCLMYADEIDLD